jgi:hypothetical protein
MTGTTSSGTSHQLRDIHSICRCCWNVATHKWKVHMIRTASPGLTGSIKRYIINVGTASILLHVNGKFTMWKFVRGNSENSIFDHNEHIKDIRRLVYIFVCLNVNSIIDFCTVLNYYFYKECHYLSDSSFHSKHHSFENERIFR